MKKINETEQKIVLQEKEISDDLNYLNKREEILKDARKYGQYIPKEIKSKEDIGFELLKNLEQLSAKSGVNLEKYNLGDLKESDAYMKYYASLNCSGELRDMVSFMHELNSTDDLFKIVGFTMSPKRGELNQVTASMTIVKLILKPDA